MIKYKLMMLLLAMTLITQGLVGQSNPDFYYGFDEKIKIESTGGYLLPLVAKLGDQEKNGLENRFGSDIKIGQYGMTVKVLKGDRLGEVQSSVNARDILNLYRLEDGTELAFMNEIVVRFKEDMTSASAEEYFRSIGATIKEFAYSKYIVYPPEGKSALAMANQIQESGKVIFAHPDIITDISIQQHIPNDSYFNWQFALHNTGQMINDGHIGTVDADVDGPEVWDVTTGVAAITVAVIDEGVTDNHPDLPGARQNRLPGSNFGALVGSGLPNDPSPVGNGNHGNACAGIIAAEQDNNEGVTGIAPGVTIMPIRMFFGGSTGNHFANAIIFAHTNGADVISNSWGTSSSNPNLIPAITNAIQDAATNGRGGLGSVVVFSAGNTANRVSGNNGFVTFPSNVNVAGVLTVGSSDRDDLQANYSPTSNPASANNQIVDLTAPSHKAYICQIPNESFEIWSIDIPGLAGYNQWTPTGTCVGLPLAGEQLPGAGTNFNSYTGRMGGTSAACPLVAGIAALVLSTDNSLTQLEVFDLLTCASEEVGPYVYDATGYSNQLGFGRANAFRSVMLACPVSYNIGWLLANGTTIEYAASDFITANNLIETNTEVEYHADNSVRLQPGFRATAGTQFRAYIKPCDNCEDIIAPSMRETPNSGIAINDLNVSEQRITPVNGDMKIFPNPGKGEFNVRTNNLEQQSILEVLDLQGRQLMQFQVTPGEDLSVDLKNYADGIYLFRLISGAAVTTEKVMLSR